MTTEKRTQGFRHEPGGMAETNEWYTPPYIFEKLGIEFDLDPCAPVLGTHRNVPAKRFLSSAEDGLRSEWRKNENVFLNPPYNRKHISSWVGKLALHGKGIALVFARTETIWFQDIASMADAICFVRGRVEFLRPDGSRGRSTAPSCLIAWGHDNVQALVNSGLGIVVDLNKNEVSN